MRYRLSQIGETLAALSQLLFQILALATGVSGLVAAVWLLIIGEWVTVLGGLAAVGFGPMVLTVVMLPALGIASLAAGCTSRRRRIIFTTLSAIVGLYQVGVVLVFTYGAFLAGVFIALDTNRFLGLIWGYSVTIGVLGRMAAGSDGGTADVGLFYGLLLYISFTVLFLLCAPTWVWWLVATVFSILAFGLTLLLAHEAAQRRRLQAEFEAEFA